jgi:FHA domain-containing protein
MPLNAKLVVVGGEVKSAEIKLRLPSTIGRGRGATIMLPHPLVSRQHCELFETNGRLMVRDLGSLNGTFVNNERISEAALPPGELLTVGAVTFRAVYDQTDSGGPPEGPGPRMRSSQSRDTDPTGTVRAASSPAAEPVTPAGDDVDFNFEMPLAPVDETARPADAANRPQATRSPASPAGQAAGPGKSAAKPAAPAPAKPAAPSPAKPTTPAPAKQAPNEPGITETVANKSTHDTTPAKDAKTVDFSQWEQDEEPKPASQDDDDFGDFLKSLGNK